MTEVTANDRLDLLYGAPAIADYLGVTTRTVYHLIESEVIPHFRMGKIICARRSRLAAKMDQLETQPAA